MNDYSTGTSTIIKSEVFRLNSGYDIPIVGYGTFRSKRGEVKPAVLSAIRAGYRHFDLAHVYGNEKEIGMALSEAFQTGLIKREDLFITGKLWNSDHESEIVPQACEYSLNDLQLDYFDLYIVRLVQQQYYFYHFFTMCSILQIPFFSRYLCLKFIFYLFISKLEDSFPYRVETYWVEYSQLG